MSRRAGWLRRPATFPVSGWRRSRRRSPGQREQEPSRCPARRPGRGPRRGAFGCLERRRNPRRRRRQKRANRPRRAWRRLSGTVSRPGSIRSRRRRNPAGPRSPQLPRPGPRHPKACPRRSGLPCRPHSGLRMARPGPGRVPSRRFGPYRERRLGASPRSSLLARPPSERHRILSRRPRWRFGRRSLARLAPRQPRSGPRASQSLPSAPRSRSGRSARIRPRQRPRRHGPARSPPKRLPRSNRRARRAWQPAFDSRRSVEVTLRRSRGLPPRLRPSTLGRPSRAKQRLPRTGRAATLVSRTAKVRRLRASPLRRPARQRQAGRRPPLVRASRFAPRGRHALGRR